jgi:uncharacterized protein (DUF2062 family)
VVFKQSVQEQRLKKDQEMIDIDIVAMIENAAHSIKRLLSLDDTPERIAKAFALGVFLAFSPLIGLHAFLGVMLPFFFSLNRFALLLGVFINNPWTLIPIYAAGTYLGGLLIGFPSMPTQSSFEWEALWSDVFWRQLAGHWHILKPMILGSFVLSILLSAFSYFSALYLIRQRRARREKC